jgi:protein O-GlcNAc transferase
MEAAARHFHAGELGQAEAAFRIAVQRDPGNWDAHNNLGVCLQAGGRLLEAESCFRRAIELRPGLVESHSNLAGILIGLGRAEEAEQGCRRALELDPRSASALNNLGIALSVQFRQDEAMACYLSAIAVSPQHAGAHFNLGASYEVRAQHEKAAHHYGAALAARPQHHQARAKWIQMRCALCEWRGLNDDIAVLVENVRQQSSADLAPLTLLAFDATTAQDQKVCAQTCVETTCRDFMRRAPMHRPGAKRGDRLRIGYLSGDFRDHSLSYLCAGAIEAHDRQRFEIIGYSHGPDDGGVLRKRMQRAFEPFHDIRALSFEDGARRIAADEIDILVDLSGLISQMRPQILALRPAPVQVNWLGYPGTLGSSRLADYMISDRTVTPQEHAAYYSEALALMPNCYQANDRRPIAAAPSREDAGLPASGMVFCSFNQSFKITPAMFDLWSRILRAIPDSVLWLLQSSDVTRANLQREARARGLAPERLVFAPQLPPDQHLGRMQLADLALDTFPYTSHTTGSDALWAGVPLVTMIGETFPGRVAASLLRAAGLPELVTQDAESYFRVVLDLATNAARLHGLRQRLAQNRLDCPLFDAPRFARDLERLYQRMWENHCRGKHEAIVI